MGEEEEEESWKNGGKRERGGKWNCGTAGPGIPGKTLLLLAVVLLGDTQAPEDHLTCFMQTY